MILSVQIPTGSHATVKTGDTVDFDTPLFETPSQTEYPIEFAQKLGAEPSKIFHFLKKFVGEDVHKGDILAIRRSVLSTKTVTSEYDGKIKEIDHVGGTIIITTKEGKHVMNSLIKGEVVEIKNKMMSIQVKDGKEFNLKKSSVDFGGKTFFLDTTSVLLSAPAVANRVLVTETISSYTQSKIEALGIRGYVTLIKLPDETTLPNAQLKTVDDFKEIMKTKDLYCFIDSRLSKIVFYK